ncbi:hypothetical protein BJY16_007294 [Actinoplanes octamycinicus]|uniref:Peptidase inhibitor family I36 n=1 Tax=Actinoplanes octamycinicus TaxID=135948 RepID=A0A7W7MBH8_9ACTN|nr:peptidase inhibitor family I36 protein [Actinoplanes octamycinicus]MBB4743835.1 hypothetical protein [Actinoplanes octamycinicus]GIE58464.1 hypothetical protein Aoc01nite_38660 [Actinoplanes octamycinicus]
MNRTLRPRTVRRAALATVLTLTASLAGVLAGTPAQAAESCHASGYACLYEHNDFHGFQDDFRADRVLPSRWDNKMSSFRNRTTCAVRLYDSARGTGRYVTVAAGREVRSLGNTFGSFWNDRVSFLDFCP